jgi:hypothetical protein
MIKHRQLGNCPTGNKKLGCMWLTIIDSMWPKSFIDIILHLKHQHGSELPF